VSEVSPITDGSNGLVVTIAIPTHNRADLVVTAVESLRKQDNTGPEWRVLVVDNGSTDATASRLQEIAGRWPRLTVEAEPTLGSSAARNRAIAACQSAYILFVDDDCTFPTDYVDRALSIIRDKAPVMFGGPIHPWYSDTPPNWFRDEYGSFSLPHGTGRSPRIYMSGANIGFLRQALLELGGFDASLGIHGAMRGYGEETEIEARIIAKRGTDAIWFDRDFINFHLVRPEKYRWRHLLADNFQRGLARAKVAAISQAAGPVTEPPIPDCLRPTPPPPPPRSQPAYGWQNLAYERGLPLVRLAGYAAGRIGRLGRSRQGLR